MNGCGTCGGEVVLPDGCRCLDVVARFSNAMICELQSNAAKGGRDGERGWLGAPVDVLLAEIHDHAAKLHIVVRELSRRRDGHEPRSLPWGDRDPESLVREFAADTANMTMMLVDSLGVLDRRAA